MRRLLWIVLAAVLGYGALVGLAFAFQRSLIYFPPQAQGDPAAVGLPEMQPVHDGNRLAGWYVPAVGNRPTIVFYHGNATIIAQYAARARRLIDAGYGLFLTEYRGYGGNPGQPSETGLYEDGRFALDWLDGQAIPHDRIVLWGESLGTGIAVQMAAERPAAALMLEAPYTRLSELAPPLFPQPIARRMMQDRFDSLDKIGRVTVPLLVIHGEADRTIPVAMGRRMLDTAGGAKTGFFPPDGVHADLWRFGAGEAILDFLTGLNQPRKKA